MTNPSLDLGNSLIVTVIGMVIVFFGLTVLIFLIKALIKLTDNLGKSKKTKAVPSVTPSQVPAAAPVPPQETEEENDDELIAVITAAIACMMDEGQSFTVRHVRRISSSPAWSRAGREEQMYSHY